MSVIWYFGRWFARCSSPRGCSSSSTGDLLALAAACAFLDFLGRTLDLDLDLDFGSGWTKWFWFQGAEDEARMASQMMASDGGSEARVEG
jgi:hypothetical protein